MRRAGSLLSPPGLLLPATPVFADVLPVYERLNRLRVTVDPAAPAAAIWSSDAVGHILSISRPLAARTRSPVLRQGPSALRSGGSPRAPARSGAAPVGQVVERACDWAGVPPELDPEIGPGLGHHPLPGMPGGPDCREAGGSRGPGRVPDRDAEAPSRPESLAGSGPGWQNWQMDESDRQARGRWPASLPVAMGGLVSVYRR